MWIRSCVDSRQVQCLTVPFPKEAHETLAIAMNMLHGKSNTGEGGERFRASGSDRKNVLQSNRLLLDVSVLQARYLGKCKRDPDQDGTGSKTWRRWTSAREKVYPWISKNRHSTPGVGLISPPPHHDIYSIEDLAQLIYDCKNANKDARISVKLVSEAGVGTVAAGVAKAGAQVILISGYDGGTGAAPSSSIHNAGLPWELGLAETHQTLIQNGLRE